MDTFSHVPPGFRFHPTDEELVDYYLRKKIASKRIDLDVIRDVDLYNIEPWDLLELCKLGSEDQSEWHFFSHKDKKYPTGTRTNRATKAGFWKATGRDKAIYSKHILIGMRKTLVFYKGRAPTGQKSDWIMHEYRLETNENATPQEEGWVVCRVFKKRIPTTTQRLNHDHESPSWYNDHELLFISDFDSPKNLSHPPTSHNPSYASKQQEYHDHHRLHNSNMQLEAFVHLPQLESPYKVPQNSYESNNIGGNLQCESLTQDDKEENVDLLQVTADWRVLDRFVASQLSQEDGENQGGENMSIIYTPSCQIDLWK